MAKYTAGSNGANLGFEELWKAADNSGIIWMRQSTSMW
jgi:hypothetical protein